MERASRDRRGRPRISAADPARPQHLRDVGERGRDRGSAEYAAGRRSVLIAPSNPSTNQTLTATVTSHDADGDPLTTAYQWTRNGTDISGATASTLNLATAGNGDRGDLIRVRVTVSDGPATSQPMTSNPVTVVNTAPSATVSLAPANPQTDATLTATATKADADGDAVGLTFVWTVNGTERRTFSSASALTDTFNLATAGNGDPAIRSPSP